MDNFDWRLRGAYRDHDPDIWFPSPGCAPKVAPLAKVICAACPVQTECLEYALVARESYGIWGGLTAKERWNRLRQLRLPRVPKFDESVVSVSKEAQHAFDTSRRIGVAEAARAPGVSKQCLYRAWWKHGIGSSREVTLA
jgi:WhiB family redox-sensing transcriptional regulator